MNWIKKNQTIIIVLALALASGAAWWVYSRNTHSSIADNVFTQFAIEDTSTVNKIFIVEHNGQKVLLERDPKGGLWNLNKKYKARTDAIANLLEVIARIKVRGNVAVTARDNMMKVMASAGQKVEIYTNDPDEPARIYYVGPNTPDHCGTIMLLEIPDEGRSPEPYICHMEGFTGFLNPRFFVDEMEWRFTGIFNYPNLNFKEVNIKYPQGMFAVKYNGDNQIQLLINQQNVAHFDTLLVKDFLRRFKIVHLESYRTFLKPSAADSIAQTSPMAIITVVDKNNKPHPLSLYLKRGKSEVQDESGAWVPWDQDYFWGKDENGNLGLAQRYVFTPILVDPLAWVKH